MGSKEVLRVGVIGFGRWGSVHAGIYDGLPNAELVAVADPYEPALSRTDQLLNSSVATFQDYNELLLDPDIDAVSITVPDHLHTDAILAAVESGKHVLIEKPFTLTASDARACVEAMKEHGNTYMVNFSLRWMTPFYRAKQLIDEGKIGEPRYCYFEQSNTPEVPLNMLKWASKSNVVWFLGVHSIDMVEWLFSSRISRVAAHADRGVLAARGVDTEDFVISTCELGSGATAVIENSWILPESHTGISTCRCKIVGTKGTLNVDALSAASLSYSDDKATTALNMFGLNRVDDRFIGSPAASVEHFVECAIHGRTPRVSVEDGLSSVLVATSIIESFKSAEPVNVPGK